MATTAEELIVSLKAEGAEKAEQSIQRVQDGVDEAASGLGDASEQMQGFQQQFSGALQAAVAAVAIAVGGLLSTVPVLGNTLEGFGAIIEAVGLQIDGLLRKLGVGGLNSILFDVAAGINNLEGATADLFAVFSVGATAVGAFLTAFTVIVAKTAGLSAAFGSLVAIGGVVFNILTAIAAGIAGIVAGVSALTAGIAVAIAALVGFVAAYLTNWRGVRTRTNQIVDDIVNFVIGGFQDFITGSLNRISSFTTDVISAFTSLAESLDEWATGIATDAFEWGRNLMQRFLDGIKSLIGQIKGTLSDISASVEGQIGVDTSGGDTGTTTGPIFGGGSSNDGFQIDGRNITESTGRFRRDKTNRRGL